MKKVSTKQNLRHMRLMKKRIQREEKRKAHRVIIAHKMEKIKMAGRRIMKAQKRMMKLAKLKYGTQGQAL